MNNTPRLRPINHVAFVIDESGSMSRHAEAVERVFEEQIKTLAQQSVTLEQETRVSLYVFHSQRNFRTGKRESIINCIAYDCDVLRLPSLRGKYKPDGGTPFVACTTQALLDLSQTPELHADHAFLVYAITDGEETDANGGERSLLRQQLLHLKENWTVCALVPDQRGQEYCRDLGFHRGNIHQWDASSEEGFKAASQAVQTATTSYMTLRSQGVRSSRNLFTPQQTGSRTAVISSLTPVGDLYTVFKAKGVGKESISAFVERATGKPYVVGSAYYALVKPETIQANKRICLRTIPDGRLYSGNLDQVRAVLGLPTGAEIKVGPAELKDFQVFVQSTSVNRHVIPEQEILVVKV